MSVAFTIVRGDDEILDLAFKEPDGVTALDLTGATGIWFTAKHHPNDADADAVIRKALGVGISIVSEPNGTATVTVDAEDTADARPGVLVWDAQVRDAAGKIRTAASGSLKLVADVTRAPHEAGVPVLLPALPDTDGYVLKIIGGIPVWAPEAGGSGISKAVLTVAYADLVLEDGGGTMVDGEGDYASASRIDLVGLVPVGALILGVRFDPTSPWDMVDPGFDPDDYSLSVAVGWKVGIDQYIAGGPPVIATLTQTATWVTSVNPLPWTDARTNDQHDIGRADDLTLLLWLLGNVGGNQRGLFSDLKHQGSMEITLYYVAP